MSNETSKTDLTIGVAASNSVRVGVSDIRILCLEDLRKEICPTSSLDGFKKALTSKNVDLIEAHFNGEAGPVRELGARFDQIVSVLRASHDKKIRPHADSLSAAYFSFQEDQRQMTESPLEFYMNQPVTDKPKPEGEVVGIDFEASNIRREMHEGKLHYSIIDFVEMLGVSKAPSRYWTELRQKVEKQEGIESFANIEQLKLSASDGKKYATDCTTQEGLLRIVQSINSNHANVQAAKAWLAKVGDEKIESAKAVQIVSGRPASVESALDFLREAIEAEAEAKFEERFGNRLEEMTQVIEQPYLERLSEIEKQRNIERSAAAGHLRALQGQMNAGMRSIITAVQSGDAALLDEKFDDDWDCRSELKGFRPIPLTDVMLGLGFKTKIDGDAFLESTLKIAQLMPLQIGMNPKSKSDHKFQALIDRKFFEFHTKQTEVMVPARGRSMLHKRAAYQGGSYDRRPQGERERMINIVCGRTSGDIIECRQAYHECRAPIGTGFSAPIRPTLH